MAASGNTSGPHKDGKLTPEEREALSRRAADLGARLEKVRERRAPPSSDAGASRGAAYAIGFRMVAELVAGVGVGAFIGWALDRQFATKPWLMVVFICFGFAAAMLNIVRAAQKAQRGNVAAQRAAPSVADDDEA